MPSGCKPLGRLPLEQRPGAAIALIAGTPPLIGRLQHEKNERIFDSEPSVANADGEEGPDGKKQKAAARVLDSLETNNASDVGSWSGAPIAEYDFRVHQMKTRLLTSSEKVKQYLV